MFILKELGFRCSSFVYASVNRLFPQSFSVRTKNRIRTRLEWTFSSVSCIFVQPDLHLVPLCVGMRKKSIEPLSCICGGHVESPENKKLCFGTSKLVLKFFTARLDVQNVLFLCKIADA